MLRLTEKQKLVFYGLVRWPNLNDAELSLKIGIDRRTITSIRKLLNSKRMYETLYFPDFSSLGIEMLTVTYGSFKPFPKRTMKTESLASSMSDYPELIYSFISHTDFLNMYLATRFTDYKIAKDNLTMIYNEYGNLENVQSVHFPLELCKVIFLFDFAPSLKSVFGIELEEDEGKDDQKGKSGEIKKLTDNEKLVLYALTVFPEAVDSKIAEVTKISRPTVNSIRDRLRQEGILRELRIPNLMELGYEVLVLSHNKLDLKFMEKVYYSERIMQKHALPTQPFFLITNATEPESVLFLIFENFTKYKECQDQIVGFAKDLKTTSEDVNEILFPIEKLEILRNLNFAPIVKKSLDLDVTF